MANVDQWTRNKKIWHYILLILLSALIIGPFIIGLWTSLLPTADISSGNLLHSSISLNNYWEAFTQTPIIRYLFNSLLISFFNDALSDFLLLNGGLCLCLYRIQASKFLFLPCLIHDDAAI